MQHELLIRCSSLGKIMTEPKTKAEGELSVGAKSYLRELAQQAIFGIDFEFSSKETAKGIEVEQESINLLNRVRGLLLIKNSERRDNAYLTGECDLYDAERRRGHDLKSSWSAKTFPGWVKDCEDKLYEWQMRGYMMLWDADEWEVNYALVDTPERLIGYEPLQMHVVSHIPEHMRLTTWSIQRDVEKEAAIVRKCKAAQAYYREAIAEFREIHKPLLAAAKTEAPSASPEPVAESKAPETVIQQAQAAHVNEPAHDGDTLTLGQINALIAPLKVDAAGLEQLGFMPSKTVKAAKHYQASSIPAMVQAMVTHLQGVLATA